MLLASLFHFSQAQSFGHVELQSGFTVLVSSDVAAQISVAVICPTPSTSPLGDGEVAPLQLARLKSLVILQELVRCYRPDIERLTAEGLEQAQSKAEEYTLTNALGGFDGGEGTLDEFVPFQTDFVGLVMETTARGIQNSIMSWSRDAAASLHESPSVIRLARGFILNAETGDLVYSTQPGPSGSFFDQDPASRRLHHLHHSARVQQLIKRVAKALHESSPALTQIPSDPAVVVRFNYLSGGDLSELFTGVFSSGAVFYGNNALFRGRECELRSSGKLQQALAAHIGGKRMLNVLRDSSVDIELHVGCDGAAQEVWQALDALARPLIHAESALSDTAVKPSMQLPSCGVSTNEDVHSKESGSPRLPQQTT
ncbi:unnamed protein product [Phytophthora fragariaefolia]|uniref:Unnamed protein product n=1 Tax=Phytophthora fragariaefolia TaxID=1490495 RepID=A0A9W6U493_9STRA|nr:unnamed protein product [Phytophthora fragariaefolia]